MKPTPPKKRPVKSGEYDNKKYKFFLLDEADETLNARYIMGNVEEMYIRFGLSRQFLEGICEMLIEQGKSESNSKEVVQENILKIALNVKDRLGMLAETKQYENLALIYTKLEYDEEMEPDEFSSSWQKLKADIWSSDKALRDFFLCMAIKRTHDLKGMSKKDIMTVLKRMEAKVLQLPILVNSLIDT